MAKTFLLTSPEGKKYKVTAPDDATPEQAYTLLQNQQSDAIASVSKPGALNVLDKVNQGIYDAGGWVADKASAMGASPEVAGGAGYLANVGANLLPIEAGASLARGAANLVRGPMRSGAQWLMNSALKPDNAAHRSGDAKLAVNTMLDQGFNVSQGGVNAMSDKITGLNRQVKDFIANSTATISKMDVWDRLKGVEDRFRNQVNPAADLSAIQSVGDQFLSHPQLSGQSQIPVQLAQDLKTGTQRQLRDSYGELSGATTEAQKALAMGLREEVGKAVPEVVPALSKERDLIRTLSVAEQRVMMDLNKNPAGLSLLAQNPVAAAAFLADRSPLFKSILARVINPTSGYLPATGGRLATGGLLQQGRLSSDQ